jgi:hypothetical protein
MGMWVQRGRTINITIKITNRRNIVTFANRCAMVNNITVTSIIISNIFRTKKNRCDVFIGTVHFHHTGPGRFFGALGRP